MVDEALREVCLYETIGNQEGESDEHSFLNYLYLLQYVCLVTEKEITEDCSYHVMDYLKIKTGPVKNCVEMSFSSEGDRNSENSLLAEDRQHQLQFGI